MITEINDVKTIIEKYVTTVEINNLDTFRGRSDTASLFILDVNVEPQMSRQYKYSQTVGVIINLELNKTLNEIDELLNNINNDLYNNNFIVKNLNINMADDTQKRVKRLMLEMKITK